MTLYCKERLKKERWLEKRVLDRVRSSKRKEGLAIDGKYNVYNVIATMQFLCADTCTPSVPIFIE